MSDRLADIKAREQAAFGGPWEVLDADENGMHAVAVDGTVLVEVGDFCDAEFIAHARDDIPHLLALVESLTAERDALAATVARVEALGEKWSTELDEDRCPAHAFPGCDCHEGYHHAWDDLRAALAGSIGQEAAPDAGHKCEPYYSRSECGQCGWQEQWCVTCSRQMCGCATETTNQEDQS